jgi:hypothetical protein
MQTRHAYVPGWFLYTTRFRDGVLVTCGGTCAADAGSRALRLRDAQRGDRLAVIEEITTA